MFSKLFKSNSIIHDADARLMVNLYYDHQNNYLRIVNRLESASMSGQDNLNSLLQGQKKHFDKQSKECKKALTRYVDNHILGDWFKGVYGISPVLAAGLVAYIDITKAATVGHIWSYCGLDPNRSNVLDTSRDSRQFNQTLKRLTWLIGYSFKHFSKDDNCLYGKLYLERLEFETRKNDNYEYSDTAEMYLSHAKFKDEITKETLKSGKLSEAHIDARARRWTVKIFLSHLHRVWYELHYGEMPSKAFSNEKLSHTKFISEQIPKDSTNTVDFLTYEN